MFVYTIQPVVRPVGQQVASCIQTSGQLSNRLYNWFDNRLDVRLHDTAGQRSFRTQHREQAAGQSFPKTSCFPKIHDSSSQPFSNPAQQTDKFKATA